jgi:hypothetical protein
MAVGILGMLVTALTMLVSGRRVLLGLLDRDFQGQLERHRSRVKQP